MQDLSSLGAPSSFEPLAINNSGQVVGTNFTASGSSVIKHAFIWSSGSTQDLGTLGGANSWGMAINNSGQVTGYSVTSAATEDAFLWSAGAMQDLGTLSGGSRSFGVDVNDNGQVVGYGPTTDNSWGASAFVYTGGAMQDLNNLIAPGSGLHLQQALAVNDSGQIVGWGINSSGQTNAFLLTPVHPGDANGDNKVDINDLTIVLANYNQSGMTWSQGEFTGSGTVDINDLTIVLANYNTTYTASSGIKAVPEPSTIVLLSIAVISILAFAYRKPRPA